MNKKAEKALQRAAETIADSFANYLRFLYRTLTPQDWAEFQKILPAINSKEDYAQIHEKLHAITGLDLGTGWECWRGLRLLACMPFADLIKVADGIQGKIGRQGEIGRFKEIIVRKVGI
ncbi:MAG: hypothetical protein ABSC17_11465 [Thermacetogeniaceae bacterium]